MRRFQTARRSRKRARRSSAPWPTSTPNSRAAASRSRTSRGVMGAGPWASRWGRGYECDPQDSRPSPAVERRAGGGRNDEEYPCCISRSSAPRLRRQSAAGRRKRISGHAPSVPNEARHQIRGRLDDAGCVAPPRNSANYSSSSRLASLAEPSPTLATDFRSGTLGSAARRLTWRLGALLDDPPFDPPRKRSRGCSPALAAPWGGEIRRPAAGAVDSSGARQEPLHPVWSPPARHELLPLHLHLVEAPAERALPGRNRSIDRVHHDLVRPPPRRAPERGAGGRHRRDRGRNRPRLHDLTPEALRSTIAACPCAECRAWRSGRIRRRACSS